MKMGLLFALALLTVFFVGFWLGLNRQAKDAHLTAYAQTQTANSAHVAAIVKKGNVQKATDRSHAAEKRTESARQTYQALNRIDVEHISPIPERDAMLALISAQDLELQALKLERSAWRESLESREQAYTELQRELRAKELSFDARLAAERASKWKWGLLGINIGALGGLCLK